MTSRRRPLASSPRARPGWRGSDCDGAAKKAVAQGDDLRLNRRAGEVGFLRALEALGHQLQIVIQDIERLERLRRLEHVIAVVAGSATGLPHDVQLPVVTEPAGVLGMAAVDRVTQGIDPALRLAVEPDAADDLAIHGGGLLALAQIVERGLPP